jgi:NAD(P)-dependent dehydrogenase (short-subunit alcohol dehydrogenase family)
MTETEGGGTKIARGLVIAAVIVAAIVLIAVFWSPFLDALRAAGDYVADRFPSDTNQRAAIIAFLVLAVLLGILFSNAGHFTAYGLAMGLGPLLWVLFWEGFPPLGLSPTWKDTLNVNHLGPTEVAVWAIVGAAVITLVFVPLELREKYRMRKRALDTD